MIILMDKMYVFNAYNFILNQSSMIAKHPILARICGPEVKFDI